MDEKNGGLTGQTLDTFEQLSECVDESAENAFKAAAETQTGLGKRVDSKSISNIS